MSSETGASGEVSCAADSDVVWKEGGLAQAEAAGCLATAAFDPAFREAWTIAQIAAQLQSGGSWLDLGYASLPASKKWKLLAFALNRFVDEDTVELLLFAVAPDARRKGIGRHLLSVTTDAAREKGAKSVFLEVRSSNQGALKLYEGFGFTAIGQRPGYYRSISGEYIDAITLLLSLD